MSVQYRIRFDFVGARAFALPPPLKPGLIDLNLLSRGVLQETVHRTCSGLAGVGPTSFLYGLAHCTSGNPMLILAAGVCGLFRLSQVRPGG